MMSGNAVFLQQKYAPFSSRYRARVARRIDELAMLPAPLTSVITTYLCDEEQFISMRYNLLERLRACESGKAAAIVRVLE